MQKLPDAASLTPDQLVERWTLWLKETQTEAFHLYWSRFMFENIQGMFKTNPPLANSGVHVLNWIFNNFFTEYLISVRREMDTGSGFLTLANFLIELEKYSETVLTRKRFVSLYKSEMLHEYGIPDKDFDMQPGATCRYPREAATTDYISSCSVRRAAKQLAKDTRRAVKYANWFIAHRTRQKPLRMTITDMYVTVNRIFDVYARYYWLVTGGTWVSKYPEPQYNWAAPFMFAWITKEFKPFEPPKN